MTEKQPNPIDTVKLGVAVLLMLGAVFAYYWYQDVSRLLRSLALVGTAGVAIFIVLQTIQGRTLYAFLKDSQVEVRKVVWPTRQETIQTTAFVILIVLIVAVFLWMLDSLLGFTVGKLLGG